jgi:predicted P-loop ATPase
LSEIPPKLAVTYYTGLSDNAGTRYAVTWPELVHALSVHDIRPDKDGPLFTCVEHTGPRRKENVTAVHALVLDIEHIDAARADEIHNWLEPFTFVIYSSHRSQHRGGEVRFRVVIPYTRPVTPEIHDRIWSIFKASIPEMDDKCRTPEHFYYLPSCPLDYPPLVLVGHGVTIDADAAWIRDFPSSPSRAVSDQSQARPVHEVAEGRFKRVLQQLAKSNKPTAAAFERLLRGVPFAQPGNRDTILFQMVSELAAELPNADPQSIAAHFATSLSFMAVDAAGAPSPTDVAYKFSRAVAALAGSTDKVELRRSTSGVPVACDANIKRILQGDLQCKGCFAFNEFSNIITVAKPVPWGGKETPREIADHDLAGFSCWVYEKYSLNVKLSMILVGAAAEAQFHSWHPVRDYLSSLVWDGTPRLDTWLIDLMGCADSEYTRKASRWWLMQAAARIKEPGCQADYALLLVGMQGVGKSTLAKTLAGHAWFTDDAGQIGSKDSALNVAGRWIVELAELSSVRKADTDTVKSFITRQWDKFRVPYGRLVESFPRQCVFIGTTNDPMPLVDRTGNRRFWPIQVHDRVLDVTHLAAIRDQLWAEAWARVQAGEQHFPEREDLALFAAEAAKFEADDSLSDLIDDWLENPLGWTASVRLTTRYVMGRILGIDRATRQDELRAISCLLKAGFKRDGKVWRPPVGWAPKVTQTLLRAV